jgi:hypothetical protein
MSPDDPIDPNDRPTLDELPPANDHAEEFGSVTIPSPIPMGQAQAALSAALDDLARAYVLVEATAMACARALDALAEAPT